MGLSEEALESKQKSARSIRKFRCFQGNLMDNLVQAHETMQWDSDLYLLQPYEVVRSNVSSITHNCFLFFLINKVFTESEIILTDLNF